MKKIQHDFRTLAGTPWRSCLALSLMAGSASAQLPASPPLPTSVPMISLDATPSAPPSLEFHAPLPCPTQLPVDSLPEVPRPLMVRTTEVMPIAEAHKPGNGQLQKRTMSIVGLSPRRVANAKPTTVAAPPVLPPIASRLTPSTTDALQSPVAQVQFTQVEDLPEVPEFLRSGNRSSALPLLPANAAGSVAHAYVATEVAFDSTPARDPNGAPQSTPTQTAQPLTDTTPSPSDSSLLSLVDGFATDAQSTDAQSTDAQSTDAQSTDALSSDAADRSASMDQPVIKGPVAAVPLEEAVGSLLDEDVTGLPGLSSAVRGQQTASSKTSSGTHFSMKDDDEVASPSTSADWHATVAVPNAIAISKPANENSKTQSTRSKVEVHDTFSSRTPLNSSSPSSSLAAKADKGDVRTESLKSDSKALLTNQETALKPFATAMRDIDSSNASDTAGSTSSKTTSKPERTTANITARNNAGESVKNVDSGSATDAKRSDTVQTAPTRNAVENPIAFSRPIVQAVKQTSVTFPGDTIDFSRSTVTQSSHVIEAGQSNMNYRDLAMQLHQAVKGKFPGSRVEIKSDEEGLIVQGLAASEAEATKILSFVRKASLCPVTDQVKTRR